jgi:hypothetical protein
MYNRRPGCLSGLLKLFLLDKVFDWLQERFGYRSGSCMGCGCGTIFLIIFVMIFISIIFGTDWFRFSF